MIGVDHPLLRGALPVGWTVSTVDEIKSPERHSCVAGPFGSSISSKFFVSDGVPVIRGSNLILGMERFISDAFVFISNETAGKFSAQTVVAGDLVFTCWGTIGQVGLIPQDGPFKKYVISNKQLKLRVDSKKLDPLYAYYYFACPEMIEYIQGRAVGSAVPGINLGILKSLPVVVPPLATQRRIASILGAYDDLIEVNRRRVKLLEEMARGLFEEWFVRFRFPGHETIPLVDTPRGKLPNGWKFDDLGTVLELAYGRALKSTDRQEGKFPVIGSSGVVGTHVLPLESGPGIIVGRKGNVGAIIWTPVDYWPIDTVYFVRSKFPKIFLLNLLRRVPFQNTDAAVPGLNRSAALKKVVAVPPPEICEKYEHHAYPMQQMIDALIFANERLAASRDLLLPRLISGQLSVEAAEPMLAAAD